MPSFPSTTMMILYITFLGRVSKIIKVYQLRSICIISMPIWSIYKLLSLGQNITNPSAQVISNLEFK